MYADGNWQAVEGVLSKDMATVGEYLQIWKLLKLSTTKVVSVVFNLNNKEATTADILQRHPICWASSQRSHTVSSMLRHEAFNSLSAQLSTGWKCTTSQIKAPTCTHCTTTHQFIWLQQQKRSILGIEVWSGWRTLWDAVLHPRNRHPLSWNGPVTNSVGLAQLTPHQCQTFTILTYTNGVWPLLQLVNVAQKNTPLTMLFFTVQSIDLPSAWCDGSGWQDNQMVAQHLPRSHAA